MNGNEIMKYVDHIQNHAAPASAEHASASAEQLSALFDGHISAEQAAALVRQSLVDDSLMLQWRSMSVTSQVLREGAAVMPLAVSPVALPISQPLVQEAANDGVFRWKMVAGIAGMATVGALVWGLLGQQPAQLPSGVHAQQGAGQAPVSNPAGTPLANANRTPEAALIAVQASPDAPVMIRDPRLDELLAAHRQFGGVSALHQPAGSLRSASLSSNRP
jgi:sigma-E factor negative regulatory protein RseA